MPGSKLNDCYPEFFTAYREADDEAMAALESDDLEAYKSAVLRAEAALHEIKTLVGWKPNYS